MKEIRIGVQSEAKLKHMGGAGKLPSDEKLIVSLTAKDCAPAISTSSDALFALLREKLASSRPHVSSLAHGSLL